MLVSRSRLNTLHSVLANGIYALFQWMLLVVVARLSQPETLGVFSLALAISAPIFLAANMRLRFVQSADQADRWNLSDFRRLRAYSSAAALIICCGFASWWISDPYVMWVVLVVAVFRVAESMQDVCIGVYQKHSKMQFAVQSTLTSGIVILLAFATTFSITQSLILASAALAVGRCVVLIFVDLPAASRIANSSKGGDSVHGPVGGRWVGLMAYAWPLGIAAAMDSLNANIPRYFLAGYSGAGELGLYVAMTHVSFVGFVIVNAIGQSLLPELSARYASADLPAFWKCALRLMVLAGLVGLVGMLAVWVFGQDLVLALYGSEFRVEAQDFMIILLGGSLSYVGLASIFVLSAIQRIRAQVYGYGIGTIGCAISGATLIPSWGVVGAAWSTVVAYALQLIVWMMFIRLAAVAKR